MMKKMKTNQKTKSKTIKPAKLYIYLFRHGQTTYNRDGRFTGWHNPKLTAKGKKNAANIGKMLKNKQIDVAIRSDLTRSKQTLDIALKGHDECKKIIVDKRMRERDYGLLDGMTHEKFIMNVGKKLYDLEVHGDAIYNIEHNHLKNKVEHFLGEEEYNAIHRGWNTPPPKGESFAMVEKRVAPFLKDLIKMMKKEKVNVAISAHGNSIRLFRKIMEKASIKETCEWAIPFDKPYIYKISIN